MKKISLLLFLAGNDFKKRFRGSYFGIFWMFMQPIVSIVIYYCVFQLGFKSNPVKEIPFVIWLLPGIIVWFYHNDAQQNGVFAFTSYKNVVTKLVFDIQLLPLVKVFAAFFVHLIFVAVMILVFIIWGREPSAWWLQVFYYIICGTMLNIGIVYITSTLHVFMKDVGQLVGILLQFGFWLAPVMYTPEIMPQWFQKILQLNPLCYVVQGFRDSLIYQVPFWKNTYGTFYFWSCCTALLIIGRLIFSRLREHLVDVM